MNQIKQEQYKKKIETIKNLRKIERKIKPLEKMILNQILRLIVKKEKKSAISKVNKGNSKSL
jgi:hypothetical protein